MLKIMVIISNGYQKVIMGGVQLGKGEKVTRKNPRTELAKPLLTANSCADNTTSSSSLPSSSLASKVSQNNTVSQSASKTSIETDDEENWTTEGDNETDDEESWTLEDDNGRSSTRKRRKVTGKNPRTEVAKPLLTANSCADNTTSSSSSLPFLSSKVSQSNTISQPASKRSIETDEEEIWTPEGNNGKSSTRKRRKVTRKNPRTEVAKPLLTANSCADNTTSSSSSLPFSSLTSEDGTVYSQILANSDINPRHNSKRPNSGSLNRDDTQMQQKRFPCMECDKSYTTKSSLNHHVRSFHMGERPYSCGECEYTCTTKQNLNTHMLTHTGEKPYSCDECEYTCARLYSLNTHMLTHTGDKPHHCPHCLFSCTQAGNLTKHIRAKHK